MQAQKNVQKHMYNVLEKFIQNKWDKADINWCSLERTQGIYKKTKKKTFDMKTVTPSGEKKENDSAL